MRCKICGKTGEVGELIGHLFRKHPKEMEELLSKTGEKDNG